MCSSKRLQLILKKKTQRFDQLDVQLNSKYEKGGISLNTEYFIVFVSIMS